MVTLGIAFNYIRRHMVKFLLVTLACGILISSIIVILISGSVNTYNNYLQANTDNLNFSRIFFDCENTRLTDSVLAENYAGRQDITGSVQINGDISYIAYMDDTALSSFNIKLLHGNMPKSKNEIAVSESVLKTLGAEIGDTVKLAYTDGSGDTDREFTISGIITDVYDALKNTDLFAYPYTEGDEPFAVFPTIITAKQENCIYHNIVENIAANILVGEDAYVPFIPKTVVKNNDTALWKYEKQYENSDNVSYYLNIITVVLVVSALFCGVYVCVRIISDGQKKNLSLLKTVGATGKQCLAVFLWQAAFISAVFSAISIVAGIGFVKLFNMFLASQNMIFFIKIPYEALFITAGAAFIGLMIFYVFHFCFVSSAKMAKRAVIKNDEDIAFEKLWNKTAGRQSNISKSTYNVVVCALTAIFSVGCFMGDIAGVNYTQKIVSIDDNVSYLTSIKRGDIYEDYYNYEVPSYNGFTSEELNSLNERYKTSTLFQGMHLNINSYITTNEEIPNGLKEQEKLTLSSDRRELLMGAGYKEFKDIYRYRVKAVPFAYLKAVIGESDITEEEFDKGERVISVNGSFDKNEKISLSFMFVSDDYFLANESQTQKTPPEVCFADVTVTDTVNVDPDSLPSLVSRFAQSDYLLVSDKYLLSLSDKFRFDYVALSGDKNISPKAAQEIDTELSDIVKSKGLDFDNYVMYPILMQQEKDRFKSPFIGVSVLYLIIVALFGSIFINSEIKSKSRYYALLRSMGISFGQLSKIIIYNACRKTFVGAIAGTIISIAVNIFFITTVSPGLISYLPFVNLIIYPLIVAAAVNIINTVSAFSALVRIEREEIYHAIVSEIF